MRNRIAGLAVLAAVALAAAPATPASAVCSTCMIGASTGSGIGDPVRGLHLQGSFTGAGVIGGGPVVGTYGFTLDGDFTDDMTGAGQLRLLSVTGAPVLTAGFTFVFADPGGTLYDSRGGSVVGSFVLVRGTYVASVAYQA